MRDESAFLATIIAAPDDDSPRLVFADWLEENRQEERAEFVRVQCELARLSKWPCGGYYCDESVGHVDCADPTGERCDVLLRRERELLWAQNVFCRHCEWHAPLPHNASFQWKFRRGFVESVTCTATDWLAHGKDVLACQPVVAINFPDGGVVRVGCEPVRDFLEKSIIYANYLTTYRLLDQPHSNVRDVSWDDNPAGPPSEMIHR